MPSFPLFQPFCNCDQMLQLLASQMPGSAQKLARTRGVDGLRIEKFLRRDAKVVADIEKTVIDG